MAAPRIASIGDPPSANRSEATHPSGRDAHQRVQREEGHEQPGPTRNPIRVRWRKAARFRGTLGFALSSHLPSRPSPSTVRSRSQQTRGPLAPRTRPPQRDTAAGCGEPAGPDERLRGDGALDGPCAQRSSLWLRCIPPERSTESRIRRTAQIALSCIDDRKPATRAPGSPYRLPQVGPVPEGRYPRGSSSLALGCAARFASGDAARSPR